MHQPDKDHEQPEKKKQEERHPAEPFGDALIHRYTRKQAIEDGVLIDVSEPAREAGFVIPVAVTQTVWAEYISVPESVPWQDEVGRLFDVLNMAYYGIRRSDGSGATLLFELYVQNKAEESAQSVTLRLQCGPNDDLSPCITIMMPDES